jgi:hypothetical protein
VRNINWQQKQNYGKGRRNLTDATADFHVLQRCIEQFASDVVIAIQGKYQSCVRKRDGDSILNIQPIWSEPLYHFCQVSFLIVEARGESKLVNDEVQFLITANGTDHLSRNLIEQKNTRVLYCGPYVHGSLP